MTGTAAASAESFPAALAALRRALADVANGDVRAIKALYSHSDEATSFYGWAATRRAGRRSPAAGTGLRSNSRAAPSHMRTSPRWSEIRLPSSPISRPSRSRWRRARRHRAGPIALRMSFASRMAAGVCCTGTPTGWRGATSPRTGFRPRVRLCVIDSRVPCEHIRCHDDELHPTSPCPGRSGAPAMTLG